MPEYSTPTLTPAGTSKLTGMNGSSAGNFLVSDILDIIRNTFGQANGVATLDGSGKLPTAQLPDIADDVLVYASKALLPAQGVEAKIYITTDDNVLYRWDATLDDYVQLSVDLSDYATLDDLAAEESARETADANLNNAITAIDHRLDNLEQAKGSYVVQNYKDGSITPSGKGAWSIVEGLRGVSRVENNLTQNGNFADDSVWRTVNTSLTVQDNVGKVTLSDVTGSIWQYHYLISGHEYLFVCDIQASNSTMQLRISNAFGGSDVYAQKNTSWQTLVGKWTCNTTQNSQYPRIYANDASVGDYFNVRKVFCRDLNVYFGGTIPSDADTIAEIQTNYPHLLTPSEYGTRIVDASYTGVRAWARNLWDEEYEEGDINYNTGVPQGNSNYIRSVNFCEVTANTSIYVKGNNTIWLLWYDANYGYLGGTAQDGTAGGTVVTSPANARYFKLVNRKIVFDGKICINVSDSLNGTYTPYHAPSTLSLTFQGKSAGSVYDSCEPNVEVGGVAKKRTTERIGEKLITDLSFTKASGIFYALLPDAMPVADSNVVANILCEKFIRTSRNGMTQKGQFSISSSGSTVYINFYWDDISIPDFLTAMAGISFYYELATYVETLSDPLIDNTLLTEAYGRMSTVQTGTVVDGSFDMGFITL